MSLRGGKFPRSNVLWRALRIVEHLLVAPRNRQELAEGLGEPERDLDALSRDVATCRAAGLAILKTRGRKPYELDIASLPLWVTPEEYEILHRALELACQAKMMGATTMAALLARVPSAVKSAALAPEGPQLAEQVVDYEPFLETRRRLELAIARKRSVRISYRKPGKPPEIRTVHAARLIWVEGTLVFRGCAPRQRDLDPWKSVRDFRVDRIEAVDVLPSPWPDSEIPMISFSFRLPADYAYLASDFHPSCVTWEPEGAFIVTLEEASLLRARRFVLRFGALAEVIGPPELRDEVVRHVRELYGRYVAPPPSHV